MNWIACANRCGAGVTCARPDDHGAPAATRRPAPVCRRGRSMIVAGREPEPGSDGRALIVEPDGEVFEPHKFGAKAN